MSSASEPDSHNRAGMNRLYLKDTKGYKSWASKAYLNLRGDALWDVVIHSVDSLVADYRSGSAPSADVLPTRTSVQTADKVAAFRDKANRRNELACKFLANALSEEQMGHCEHLDTAKDIWDTLKGIHSLGQSSRTMDLLSVLMQPYTGDIPFKGFRQQAMLVRSLPDQYDSIVGNFASDVDIHMDWNAFYPKLLMNVELAESRNRQKASLSDRIVDDSSLVARISTTAPKDYSKSYCSRCKVHGYERGWRLCTSRNNNANVSAPPSDSDSNSNSNVAAIGADEATLMIYTFPYSKAMPVFPWIIDSGAKVHGVGDKSATEIPSGSRVRESVGHQCSFVYTNGSNVRVRSMLLDSGLPMRFWSDALAVATFVLNRRPHPRISGKTAIEVLLGKKPNLTHLQPFGSTAFVHGPKERRTKLSPRSIQGVFIGYSGEYNYRVWVQSSNKVYVSRHVSFVDTSPRAPSVVTSTQDRVDAPIPVFDPRPPSPEMLPVTPVSPVVTPPIGADQPGGDLGVVPPMDEEDEDHDRLEDFHDAEVSLDGEAEVALAPRERCAIVRTGPNPGKFENVDRSNILHAGSRRRPQPPDKVLPIIAAIMVDVLDTPPLFHDKLFYDAYCAAVFAEEDIEIPKTFEEAMKSPYRNHWIEAMEITWHEGIRVLGTIWVYNIKRDANGKIIRFKARLVAQGFAQRPGIDYHDIYAPVARSSTTTTDSEILSASSVTREAIWLRRLAGDVGIPQSDPTIIQEDNAACIQIAKDPVDHMRTKHFDIAHLFVRERVASGEVEVEYCPTHVNAADLMTKPLGPQRFDQLRALLGMVSLGSLTGGSVRSGV
ncbi:BQ5605_C016g08069 [Microbotryum silenes-dioicae]|uniref:BQ5605_C016g08069 protein n=1 Tax=Microbotryum silenes-dioicae TaxID=796604 RepID=A0A2X0MQ04_9BASI|nr:BQ5605_C016g08069 [Microbotryum silenes-dioicae]